MTPIQFLQTLQLADSFFPVGAFAYSDGLESAATNGLVRDGDSLKAWMRHFVGAVFIPCDGLALLKCLKAMRAGDAETIRRIDEELTALKPSASVRNSSASQGRRLLASYGALSAGQSRFPPTPHCNGPVAYAMVFADRGLSDTHGLLAYGYSRLAGMVSAGLRLIAMGQQQGQEILAETLRSLPAAVESILQSENEPLRAFSPLLDIQQMNHRYVYSRLFRS